jgi:hypothetical protein
MHKRLLPALILAVASTLAFSACSLLPGGGGAGGELDAEKTPLTEYFNAIYGEYDSKEGIAQQQKVEELIATCMSKEGFDYKPVDQSQNMGKMNDDTEDRDTEKWVSENGYGMNLTDEQQEEQNAEAESWIDPNEDYVNALSSAEQEAYYAVLYGPGPTAEEQAAMDAGESYEYNWETSGCQGAAQHEVTGDDITQTEKYKPLMDDINKMYEKREKMPEIVKLDAAWSSCMADAGFDFEKKDDAIQEVSDQQNAFWENATPDSEGPDDATKKQWREHELEVALADFTCGKKVDYEQKSLKAQFAMENQFIDDHKSELDALVADVEQGKK